MIEFDNCAGCGEVFTARELVAGEADTRWCARCVEETALRMSAAPPTPAPFDSVEEDDGEP